MMPAFVFALSVFALAAPNAVIEDAHRLYAPIAERAGARLTFETRLDDPLVIASADADGAGNLAVRISGGLLRAPRLTDDVLRIVLCHELGHLFAGSPRRPVPPEWDGPVGPDGNTLFSGEGQSDYYATRVCFRRLVALSSDPGDDDVSPRARTACAAEWGETENARICRRAAAASFAFLRLTSDFPISFETPDPTVAERTMTGEYPSRQCRLDTLLAGAAAKPELPLDLGSSPLPRETPERRPRCWFRPD